MLFIYKNKNIYKNKIKNKKIDVACTEAMVRLLIINCQIVVLLMKCGLLPFKFLDYKKYFPRV